MSENSKNTFNPVNERELTSAEYYAGNKEKVSKVDPESATVNKIDKVEKKLSPEKDTDLVEKKAKGVEELKKEKNWKKPLILLGLGALATVGTVFYSTPGTNYEPTDDQIPTTGNVETLTGSNLTGDIQTGAVVATIASNSYNNQSESAVNNTSANTNTNINTNTVVNKNVNNTVEPTNVPAQKEAEKYLTSKQMAALSALVTKGEENGRLTVNELAKIKTLINKRGNKLTMSDLKVVIGYYSNDIKRKEIVETTITKENKDTVNGALGILGADTEYDKDTVVTTTSYDDGNNVKTEEGDDSSFEYEETNAKAKVMGEENNSSSKDKIKGFDKNPPKGFGEKEGVTKNDVMNGGYESWDKFKENASSSKWDVIDDELDNSSNSSGDMRDNLGF